MTTITNKPGWEILNAVEKIIRNEKLISGKDVPANFET
jgi:hypothetical protein